MQSAETDDGADKSSPIAFSGVVDSNVIHDLHALFRRRVLILEWLFSEKPHPPRVLAMDGLPLHASFFESEESWMRARELIRTRIAKVRIVSS